ncbi:cytochrome c [Corticibacter populi]|uniref:Cytochrome c n=1 Tax=Corticibacter populi TaxID=1550736 RepID=A0A3M6QJR5_9BURK|nr:cytochrome c [Corticibacter populi]RMX02961.1 cytochrome c [Corticibacter populi]RZS33381.1 mono/diheme cytochrome c family protein [Corticibacter populi]
MKKTLRILGGLVVLGVLALLAFIFVPVKLTPPSEVLPADWKAEPGRGEYVMRASDCMACHTADGGAPFAGSRPIHSPLGTIWTSNITPDKETGIGNWTLDQFRAAMIDGISADGSHIYPAMPYENYRLMTEGDIRALYDYLMTEVEPVKNQVEETRLSFPFNLRFGLRAWNWLALRHDAGFTPAGTSPAQDRGQYLVEGPAHCAACHSPRTTFMAQNGIQLTDAKFLTGGVVDGWDAPSLRGAGSTPQKWSIAEMADYLATGRNAHSTANGEMTLVIEHSLQYLSDDDLHAIAAFLKGIDGAKVELPGTAVAAAGPSAQPAAEADAAGAETARMLTAASPEMPLGARLYLDNCAACHFVTGKGSPGIFPELQANSMVVGSEVSPLISVILHGASVPSTERRPMRLVMQGYADRMDDEEVAELANFLRTAWGNKASAITAADVGKVRSAPLTH